MAEARIERRLAAILAADVAGYSRLMSADETGTLAALKARRREIVDPAIAAHKGRIVKTTGDGMLVEFASAVDAVTCAVAVQEKMADQTDDGPQIRFRVGINIGDIIIDGGDIFGDGVNVAARVENECEPGKVYISGSAFEQVRGKTSFTFEDLGEKSLKNIERPIRLYAAHLAAPPAAAGAKSPIEPRKPLPLPDKPSIAVLPFQNMSGDPEQEYFTDGMVEEIITALSRFRELFVIARNSSFTYKGKAVDVKQIGRELGVRYVLEGSVRKAANRLRITGQLIDASTGGHLWADHFDGGLVDIFDLQDQVTATVVSAIAPRVEQAEIERTKSKPTERLDAYDYYLRGIAKLGSMVTLGGGGAHLPILLEARALFLKAAELDPDFALAYAMVAQCYIVESQNTGLTADRVPMVAETTRLAWRAATLGRDDAAVLSRAGQALAYVAGEIDAGAALLDRAIALNPNLAMAWNFGGWVKIFRGEPEPAIECFTRAMRLTPLDPMLFLMQLGTACGHLFAGRYDEASMWAEKALLERQRVVIVLRVAAACFALAGRLDEAQKATVQLRELSPGFRISHVSTLFPLRRPEDLAIYTEGLRKAGLLE